MDQELAALSKEECREYLAKHNLDRRFGEAVQQLLRDKPAEPFGVLRDFFSNFVPKFDPSQGTSPCPEPRPDTARMRFPNITNKDEPTLAVWQTGASKATLATFAGSRKNTIFPRSKVPDEQVSWEIPWPEYEPAEIDEPTTQNHRDCDPRVPSHVGLAEWNRRSEKSVAAQLRFDMQGRPLNPIGRTGIRGRGSLNFWGPNFAVDILVTRRNPDKPKEIQVLLKQDRKNQELKLPGNRLPVGCDLPITDYLMNKLKDYIVDAVKCKVGLERKELHDIVQDLITKAKWTELQHGYVDEVRATDNAWMESTAWHWQLNSSLADDSNSMQQQDSDHKAQKVLEVLLRSDFLQEWEEAASTYDLLWVSTAMSANPSLQGFWVDNVYHGHLGMITSAVKVVSRDYAERALAKWQAHKFLGLKGLKKDERTRAAWQAGASKATLANFVGSRKMTAGLRFHVPDEKVSWDIPWPEYEPVERDQPSAEKGNPHDPELPSEVDLVEWERRDAKSSCAQLRFDMKGRPLNPIGRTGVKGRGVLNFWGPNFAVDILVTRRNPNRPGEVQVLLKKSKKNDELKLLGDRLPLGHQLKITEVLLNTLKDYIVDALKSEGGLVDALKNEVGLDTKFQDIEDLITNAKWTELQHAYVDEERATDNAWLESTAWHWQLNSSVDSDDINPMQRKILEALLQSDYWKTENTKYDGELGWVSTALSTDGIDGTVAIENVYAGHLGMIMLAVKAVAQDQVVPLHTMKASKVVAMDVEDQERLWKSGKARVVSCLVDDCDWSRLIESLWINAGKPSGASSQPMDEIVGKEDGFFEDRQNWSKWNLKQLYIHHENGKDRNGMLALSRLQPDTSHGFESILKQPVLTISLLNSANNMTPFNEYLRPVDRSDMVSAAHRPTYFLLSRDAFTSGSSQVSRKELQELWAIFNSTADQEEKAKAKGDRHPGIGMISKKSNKGLTSLFLKATPVCAMTKDTRGKDIAGVPDDAKFFCWLYATRADIVANWIKRYEDKDKREAKDNASKFKRDAFIQLLELGGFLYFDFKFDIIDIHTLCFDGKLQQDNTGNAGSAPPKIFYGSPVKMPPSTIQPLISLDRLTNMSLPFMKQMGFTHFAYMLPSEFLGDSVFPKDGGFAYINENAHQKSIFVPIVVPGDDDPVDDELLKAQRDSGKPVSYNAPLYIAGLSDPVAEKQKSQEASGHGGEEEAKEPDVDNKFLAESQKLSDMVFANAKDAVFGVEKRLGWSTIQELMQRSGQLKKEGQQLAELEEQQEQQREEEQQSECRALEWERGLWAVEKSAGSRKDTRLTSLDFLKSVPESKQLANQMLRILVDEENKVSKSKSTEIEEQQSEQQQDYGFHRLSDCIPIAMELLIHLSSQQRQLCNRLKEMQPEGLKALKPDQDDDSTDMGRWWKSVKTWQDDARKHIENTHYVLCVKKPIEKSEEGNDGNQTVRDKIEGRVAIGLLDFCRADEACECMLDIIEVAGLRFYTSTSYGLINTPLRTANGGDQGKHPLSVTTYFITNGLKKMRAMNFRRTTAATDFLWRGLKDRTVSEHFLYNGGSEMACMSTSENIDVVIGYSQSRAPLLFRIKIESPMDRGANIKWLSVYPHEDEVLYPPMTCLQPLYKQPVVNSHSFAITMKVSFPS